MLFWLGVVTGYTLAHFEAVLRGRRSGRHIAESRRDGARAMEEIDWLVGERETPLSRNGGSARPVDSTAP
jgi:hypothetical protein